MSFDESMEGWEPAGQPLRAPAMLPFGRIVLAQGTGCGPTELAAFDAALRDAGVANYNLLCLSSVIPPGSRLERTRWVTPAEHWGHRLYVVLSQARSAFRKPTEVRRRLLELG